MRITILAIGTHGDVQPFVALGVGLLRAGHSVRLAARDNYRDFVTGHGLEFASLGPEPTAPEPQSLLAFLMSVPRKLLYLLRVAGSFVPGRSAPIWPKRLPWLDQLVKDSLRACESADAVISGVLFFWVSALAEKLNVPWYLGLLQPLTPTRSFPSVFWTASFLSRLSLGGGFNRLTHRIAERIFFAFFLRLTNPSRKEILGLPLLTNTRPIEKFYQETAILYAYSPTLSPKPADWENWQHVIGYWFLDDSATWNPPRELVDFLSSGSPPVYVGFGSFAETDPQRLTRMVVEALARTGQRGILLTGWGGLARTDLPDTIFPIQSVPHDWLFPRMAAIVHHGGAGTTGAALRAGVPSVTIPWRKDHPFFAKCAYKIGASTPPIPKRKLSVQLLADAIEAALHEPRIRERAGFAARQIANENGVARAVEIIELSNRRRMHYQEGRQS